MKYCPECKIQIGGDPDECPLCHAKLTGEPSESFWPAPSVISQKYRIFRAQLALSAGICIFMIIADLLSEPIGKVLWTPPIATWIILGELTLYKIFLKKVSPTRVITQYSLLAAAIMLVLSIWCPPALTLISIILCTMLVMNLICMLMAKEDTAMIQLMGSLGTGIISLVIIRLLHPAGSFFWMLLLVTSCAVFVITVIFKAGYMLSELKRRTKL